MNRAWRCGTSDTEFPASRVQNGAEHRRNAELLQITFTSASGLKNSPFSKGLTDHFP